MTKLQIYFTGLVHGFVLSCTNKLVGELIMLNDANLVIDLLYSDKDLSHIPLGKKDLYTRTPSSISIEFVREYREERENGVKSPSIVKKSLPPEKVSMLEKKANTGSVEPPPFNTKV